MRITWAFLAALLASACVTITPASHSDVAVLPSATPTTSAVLATPTDPTATTPEPSLGDSPLPTDARPTETPLEPTGAPTDGPTRPPDPTPTPDANDPACTDAAFELESFSWDKPFEWRYNSASTPGRYDADDVLDVIKRSFDNITSERNDCGRPDRIFENASYLGDTSLEPCSEEGDATNVVGWGEIPTDLSSDTIAYTCPYTFEASGDPAEADIVISTHIVWALTPQDCVLEELLEPTITHEVGHAFGLGHVSERQHPDLTMSTRSNGYCDDTSSTLGLGDMLGLESLYPEK